MILYIPTFIWERIQCTPVWSKQIQQSKIRGLTSVKEASLLGREEENQSGWRMGEANPAHNWGRVKREAAGRAGVGTRNVLMPLKMTIIYTYNFYPFLPRRSSKFKFIYSLTVLDQHQIVDFSWTALLSWRNISYATVAKHRACKKCYCL